MLSVLPLLVTAFDGVPCRARVSARIVAIRVYSPSLGPPAMISARSSRSRRSLMARYASPSSSSMISLRARASPAFSASSPEMRSMVRRELSRPPAPAPTPSTPAATAGPYRAHRCPLTVFAREGDAAADAHLVARPIAVLLEAFDAPLGGAEEVREGRDVQRIPGREVEIPLEGQHGVVVHDAPRAAISGRGHRRAAEPAQTTQREGVVAEGLGEVRRDHRTQLLLVRRLAAGSQQRQERREQEPEQVSTQGGACRAHDQNANTGRAR